MLKSIRNLFGKLCRDEKGATLVEYGIALLIAIGVGGTLLTGLATETQGQFQDACQIMDATACP